MTSCETTTFIASLLDPSSDQLALLCTHPPNQIERAIESPVMLPLSKINAHQIRKIVDLIDSHTERPDASKVTKTMKYAQDILFQEAVSQNIQKSHTARTYGHIIVFTCDPDSLTGFYPSVDEKVHVHVVCPGILPWKTLDHERFNGWCFSPSVWQADDFTLEVGLYKRLRKWIAQAHNGTSYGSLTNAILVLKPGPYCSIEGIMGKSTFPNLQPGEVSTTLVKVKVHEIPISSLSLADFPQVPKTFSGSIDLWKELSVLLDDVSASIMTAKLKYTHSLLPPDTQSSIKHEVRLKREIPESLWQLGSVKAESSGDDPSSSPLLANPLIQRRLIYHVATHQTPRNALHTLQEEFGVDGSRSVCQDFIKEVITELKYQAHVIERFDLQECEPIEEMEMDFRAVSMGNSDTSYCTRTEDFLSAAEETWSPSTVVDVDAETVKESGSISPAVLEGEVDEARRIWTELRKGSRSGKRAEWLAGRKGSMSRKEEEKLWQIQEVALKNKRSVGADTLISISQNGKGSESFTPWA